jgi:hypothetical protein
MGPLFVRLIVEPLGSHILWHGRGMNGRPRDFSRSLKQATTRPMLGLDVLAKMRLTQGDGVLRLEALR